MKEKVSIIVPIYNSSKTLDRCIKSLLAQSYDNIEIILVNDGSKDSSYSICESYKKDNSNIILKNKENGGVSSARNLGIQTASGSNIIFVDSDDYIEPNFVANFIRGGKMRFTYLFYKNIILRKSCAKCHYTNLQRPSDITLADFWGWEKTDAHFNEDNKGCSLVLCNTEKGRKLFETIQEDLDVIHAKLEDCMQPNLAHPTTEHPLRDSFEQDSVAYGFEYTMKKYGPKGFKAFLKDIKNNVLNFYSKHFKS